MQNIPPKKYHAKVPGTFEKTHNHWRWKMPLGALFFALIANQINNASSTR
jgi:hypothetical protein